MKIYLTEKFKQSVVKSVGGLKIVLGGYLFLKDKNSWLSELKTNDQSKFNNLTLEDLNTNCDIVYNPKRHKGLFDLSYSPSLEVKTTNNECFGAYKIIVDSGMDNRTPQSFNGSYKAILLIGEEYSEDRTHTWKLNDSFLAGVLYFNNDLEIVKETSFVINLQCGLTVGDENSVYMIKLNNEYTKTLDRFTNLNPSTIQWREKGTFLTTKKDKTYSTPDVGFYDINFITSPVTERNDTIWNRYGRLFISNESNNEPSVIFSSFGNTSNGTVGGTVGVESNNNFNRIGFCGTTSEYDKIDIFNYEKDYEYSENVPRGFFRINTSGITSDNLHANYFNLCLNSKNINLKSGSSYTSFINSGNLFYGSLRGINTLLDTKNIYSLENVNGKLEKTNSMHNVESCLINSREIKSFEFHDSYMTSLGVKGLFQNSRHYSPKVFIGRNYLSYSSSSNNPNKKFIGHEGLINSEDEVFDSKTVFGKYNEYNPNSIFSVSDGFYRYYSEYDFPEVGSDYNSRNFEFLKKASEGTIDYRLTEGYKRLDVFDVCSDSFSINSYDMKNYYYLGKFKPTGIDDSIYHQKQTTWFEEGGLGFIHTYDHPSEKPIFINYVDLYQFSQGYWFTPVSNDKVNELQASYIECAELLESTRQGNTKSFTVYLRDNDDNNNGNDIITNFEIMTRATEFVPRFSIPHLANGSNEEPYVIYCVNLSNKSRVFNLIGYFLNGQNFEEEEFNFSLPSNTVKKLIYMDNGTNGVYGFIKT